jgi:hypothetical protein
MKKVTVDYNGIEFELDGYYQEGEDRTHDYPGCGSIYEIYNACVNGIDIIEILVESQLEDLQNLAIEQIEE